MTEVQQMLKIVPANLLVRKQEQFDFHFPIF